MERPPCSPVVEGAGARVATPPQVKCELGSVRRNIPHIGAPCSARHSHGATGALLSGFRFRGSNSGCPTQFFFGVLPPRSATASPHMKFGASAGVLDAPDGH